MSRDTVSTVFVIVVKVFVLVVVIVNRKVCGRVRELRGAGGVAVSIRGLCRRLGSGLGVGGRSLV